MAGDHLEETTTLQKMLDATMKTLDNSGEKVQKLSGEVSTSYVKLAELLCIAREKRQSLQELMTPCTIQSSFINSNYTSVICIPIPTKKYKFQLSVPYRNNIM